jgi:hypothetical protein
LIVEAFNNIGDSFMFRIRHAIDAGR